MERFTVEQLWKRTPNKYEAIVVAALEARRIARWAREHGFMDKLNEKPTILALQNFIEGKVEYEFVEEEEL